MLSRLGDRKLQYFELNNNGGQRFEQVLIPCCRKSSFPCIIGHRQNFYFVRDVGTEFNKINWRKIIKNLTAEIENYMYENSLLSSKDYSI